VTTGINPYELGKKDGRVLLQVSAHKPKLGETQESFIATIREKIVEMYQKDYKPVTIITICERLTAKGLLKVTQRGTWATTENGNEFTRDARKRDDYRKFFMPSTTPNVVSMQEMTSS